jgi:hypothetical protein
LYWFDLHSSRSIAAGALFFFLIKRTKNQDSREASLPHLAFARLGLRLAFHAQAGRTTAAHLLPLFRTRPSLQQNLECPATAFRATIVLPALAEAYLLSEELRIKKQKTYHCCKVRSNRTM